MIRKERIGQAAMIVLDRPDRRNALTPEMLKQMRRLGQEASRSARCLVLAAEGSAFCAGFDLELCRRSPDGAAMRALLSGLAETILAFRGLNIPIVAAAHGAAIAGGCALLGGADVVVTNAEAKFGYPVVRLGVSPAVSAPYLRLAIGDGPARERLLDSRLISGREALRLGLAHVCEGEAEAVRSRAAMIAASLCEKPPAGIAATKRWLNEIAPTHEMTGPALGASLSLVGGAEEQRLLEAALRRS